MSMNIALTGILASNTDLGVISDNIANANTTGFKKARAEFGDLVDSMSGDSTGLGVRLQKITQSFKQGSIEDTGRTYDMAITGDGFFILKDSGGQTTYSRAGNFSLNDNGFLVNNSGQNVQGFSIVEQKARATSEVKYDLNLNSAASQPTTITPPAPPTPPSTVAVTDAAGWGKVYYTGDLNGDSTYDDDGIDFSEVKLLGAAPIGHTYEYTGDIDGKSMTFTFTKTDTDKWSVSVEGNEGSPTDAQPIIFSGTSVADPIATVTLNGQTLPLKLSGITQVADDPEKYAGAVKVTSGTPPTVTFNQFRLNADAVAGSSFSVEAYLNDIKNATNTAQEKFTVTFTKLNAANSWSVKVESDGVNSGNVFKTGTVGITFDSTTGQLSGPNVINTLTDIDGTPSTPNDAVILDFAGIREFTISPDSPTSSGTPTPSTFDPKDPSTYNYMTSLSVFDTGGISHDLKTYFVKSTGNVWQVHYALDDLPPRSTDKNGQPILLNFSTTPPTIPSPDITFSPADLNSTLVGNPPKSSVEPLSIKLDFSGVTSPESPASSLRFDLRGLSQNGSAAQRRLNDQGDVQLSNILIDFSNMTPRITSKAVLDLNLNALEQELRPTTDVIFDVRLDSGAIPPTSTFAPLDNSSYNYSTSAQLYDSTGNPHILHTYFVKTANPNEWNVYHTLDRDTNPNFAQRGPVSLTLSDAASPTTTAPEMTFTFQDLGTGAAALTIQPDFTNLKLNPAGSGNITNNVVANTQSANPDVIDSSNPDEYNYSTAMTVYDSAGGSHNMNLFFRKISDNNWSVYTQMGGGNATAEKAGMLTFDSRGILIRTTDANGFTDPLQPLALDVIGLRFGQGTARQNITLDFSDTSQFASESLTNGLSQDGYGSGALTGVEVDDSGKLIASYSNNQTQEMGQVALARFTNNQGLKRVGDNNWVYTNAAGTITRAAAGSSSMGKVITNALEGSNVELTTELVDMITAQRNFQANAQVINTTGTLYQAVLNIR